MNLPRLCAACALFSLIPAAAQAYVDPGSGSMIFQMIIGGLLAAGVTLKFYWGRLMGMMRGGRQSDTDRPTDD